MKSIFTLLLFLVSFTTTAQTYTEIQVPNLTPMCEMVIEVGAGEPFYILNKQVGLVTHTYILINQTSAVYVAPTLPADFTVVELFKANNSKMTFSLGQTIPIIVDVQGNSYMRIH